MWDKDLILDDKTIIKNIYSNVNNNLGHQNIVIGKKSYRIKDELYPLVKRVRWLSAGLSCLIMIALLTLSNFLARNMPWYQALFFQLVVIGCIWMVNGPVDRYLKAKWLPSNLVQYLELTDD